MDKQVENYKTSDRWEAAYLMCAGLRLAGFEPDGSTPPRIIFILQGKEPLAAMNDYFASQAKVEVRQFKANYFDLTNIIRGQRRGEGVTRTEKRAGTKDSKGPSG